MGGHWPGVHPARGAPVQMTYSASSNHAGAGMQGGAYSGYNGYQVQRVTLIGPAFPSRVKPEDIWACFKLRWISSVPFDI